jgi:hypothetical protein
MTTGTIPSATWGTTVPNGECSQGGVIRLRGSSGGGRLRLATLMLGLAAAACDRTDEPPYCPDLEDVRCVIVRDIGSFKCDCCDQAWACSLPDAEGYGRWSPTDLDCGCVRQDGKLDTGDVRCVESVR